MGRRRPCDVCGHDRKRWQRLCQSCFDALPYGHRSQLIAAFHAGRRRDWRTLCREARSRLAASVAPNVTAQAAYAAIAAQAGERDA